MKFVNFLGCNLSLKRSLYFSLKKILGLNEKGINHIFKFLGYSLLNKDLTFRLLLKDGFFFKFKNFILKSYIINKDLRLKYKFFIKKKMDIKSYHGLRLRKGYPVRGQRTHTNAVTCQKRLHLKFFQKV